MTAQQTREEQQRRDEARREEQERRNLDARLRSFDAYSFYDSIESWTSLSVPAPVAEAIQLTPLRRKVIMRQPLPLTRSELGHVRRLSRDAALLLALLRAVDQKGMECPYIHRIHRGGLERAIEKCVRIQEARKKYLNGVGLWAWCSLTFNGFHLDAIERDVKLFRARLEAILLMCRHEEFAEDLMHLRRAATCRSDASSQDGLGVRLRLSPPSSSKMTAREPSRIAPPNDRSTNTH